MLLRYKVNNNNHRIVFCPDKEGVQIKKKVNSYTSIAKDLKKNYNDKKIVLIYDKKINKDIINYLIHDLRISFKQLKLISFQGSKKNKNINQLLKIINFLIKNKFTKKSVLISCGGGVIGDICGLASSLYLRGMIHYHIPTTMTAIVDSCIGGKTGINYKGIINSLGNYYHADRVYISKNIIKLIPEREYISGIPEIIKCGLINDKKIFKLLKNKKKILDRDFKHISKLIQLSLQTKIKFFKKDVEEKNERLKLNFGHTFAHAIEMALDKKKTEIIRHGEAVAIGLLCEIFYAKGDNNDFKKTKEILEMFNIPNNLNSYRKRTAYTELKKKIFQNIFLDKKRIGLNPRYIKLTNIGKSNISEMKNYNRIYKTIDYVIFGKKINA